MNLDARIDAAGLLSDPVALASLRRDARSMRSRAVSDLFHRFGDWLEQAVWHARQRDLASYLSQATDHADLERRMRSLQHAGH